MGREELLLLSEISEIRYKRQCDLIQVLFHDFGDNWVWSLWFIITLHSFATRFAHIFAHIFATGNEIQKYFSARSNSFDLTQNSVKAVLTWTRAWVISLWCALMFFVDKMFSRPPYQTVETYIVNKTAFAEFCFSKLFSRSFVSNLVAKLSRGTGL